MVILDYFLTTYYTSFVSSCISFILGVEVLFVLHLSSKLYKTLFFSFTVAMSQDKHHNFLFVSTVTKGDDVCLVLFHYQKRKIIFAST